MKQFNLIITCKFSDFARAYTGLNGSDECMALIEEQDQMSFADSQINNKFLTKTDMIAIWDFWVEVQIDNQMENGVYILNLTVTTPSPYNPYNGSIIQCDCVELEEILHSIIKHNI